MKKTVVIILLCFLLCPTIVTAGEKVEVEFSKCVDGDTARFLLDGKEIKTRFLAVDTPETKHPSKGVEPFGPEASDYTCTSLKKASSIVLEYDDGSTKTDKYDRHLVWVFVDNELLQEQLVEKGLAKVAYLYGDYQYTEKLQTKESAAKRKQVGIWGDYVEPTDYTIYYIIGGAIILFLLAQIIPKIGNKEVKKIARKQNTKIKKDLKKNINKIFK